MSREERSTRFYIAERAKRLGFTHDKIIEEVCGKGIKCSKVDFSRAIKGVVRSANAESICVAADEILSEKEKRLGQ